jgi:hypothetical protein
MLVDRLRDDGLNAGPEPLCSCRTLPRQEGRDITVTPRHLPQQRPYTPALDPEFLCDGVHIGAAAGGQAGQTCKKIAPARSLAPLRVAETSLVHRSHRWASDAFVNGKTNLRGGRRHDFAGIVAEQHGIWPERHVNAPTSGRMLDLDSRDEALLHVTACRCCNVILSRPDALHEAAIGRR